MSDEFQPMSFMDLPDDLAAQDDVSKSALIADTLPAGAYVMNLESIDIKDDRFEPGRTVALLRFRDGNRKAHFTEVSWEPSEKNGVDFKCRLYAALELAVDMYGGPVKEVFAAAYEQNFIVTVNEQVTCKVGQLPEEQQTYYMESKGLGTESKVYHRIPSHHEELRNYLLKAKMKLRNQVVDISNAPSEDEIPF